MLLSVWAAPGREARGRPERSVLFLYGLLVLMTTLQLVSRATESWWAAVAQIAVAGAIVAFAVRLWRAPRLR